MTMLWGRENGARSAKDGQGVEDGEGQISDRPAPPVNQSEGGWISQLIAPCRSLLAGIHAPRQNSEPAAEARWEAHFRAFIDALNGLMADMEKDFLAMGGRLQELHRDVREISKLSSSVTDLIAGDEITASVEGLHGMLSRFKELDSGSMHRSQALRRVMEALAAIDHLVAGFNNIMRALNVLCVTVKIENARFGESDTGFGTLAEDIKKLSIDIESKFNSILVEVKGLQAAIRRTLSLTVSAEKKHRGQGRAILDRMMQNLESLDEKHRRSSISANHLASSYEDVSRKIGAIVTSIQFHDIARQRFEHVREAIEGLFPLLARFDGQEAASPALRDEPSLASSGGDGPCGGKDDSFGAVIEVANVCQVQTRQLQGAETQIVRATRTILDSLRETSEAVLAISRDTRGLAGSADDDGQSFLSEVEEGLSAIADILSEYTDINRGLSESMRSVAGTVLQLSAHVKEIERIGTQIRLIALNAIVKAAHIGEEGAALEVLAEAVHRLSIDTCENTSSIIESFNTMASVAEELATESERCSEEGDEANDRTAEELSGLISSLRGVDESIVDTLRRIDAAGKDASEAIGKTIDGVSIHETVTKVVDAVVSELNSIIEECKAIVPQESWETGRMAALETLEASYTMEYERLAHQSALESEEGSSEDDVALFAEDEGGGAPGSDGKSDPEDLGEDLGDNVELF